MEGAHIPPRRAVPPPNKPKEQPHVWVQAPPLNHSTHDSALLNSYNEPLRHGEQQQILQMRTSILGQLYSSTASSPASPNSLLPPEFSSGQPQLAYFQDYSQAQQQSDHPYQQSPLPSYHQPNLSLAQPSSFYIEPYSSVNSPGALRQHPSMISIQESDSPHLKQSSSAQTHASLYPNLMLSGSSDPNLLASSHGSTDRWGNVYPAVSRHATIPTRVASASSGHDHSASPSSNHNSTLTSNLKSATTATTRVSSPNIGISRLNQNLRRNLTDNGHQHSESTVAFNSSYSAGFGLINSMDGSQLKSSFPNPLSKGNRVRIPSRGDSRHKDRAEDLQIPCRNASKQKASIDDLINAGLAALSAPKFDIRDAVRKWSEALVIADQARDLFRKAKAQSNIGCTLRNAGHVVTAKNYLEASWDSTVDYIRMAATKYPSNWLQIAIRALDLEGDQVEEAFVTASERVFEKRPASIRSVSSEASTSGISTSGASIAGNSVANSRFQSTVSATQHEPALGPPILIWLLQLTTNLGNVYFSNGEYQLAVQQHETCKRLVGIILEEYPLPEELVNTIQNPTFADSSSVASQPSPIPNGVFSAAPATLSKQYRLSYLHRQTLLAQARSLTHLGTCFGVLGLTASSLQSHMAANTLLATVASHIPSLANMSYLTATRSTSKSQPQVGLVEITGIQAAIAANIGCAWHAAGELGKAVEWHERGLAIFSSVWAQPVLAAAGRPPSRQGHSMLSSDSSPSPSPLPALILQPDTSQPTVLPRSIDETRQLANLASLYIDVAQSINSMDWLSTIHSDSVSSLQQDGVLSELDSKSAQKLAMDGLSQYWQPPFREFLEDQCRENTSTTLRYCTEPLFDRGLGMLYDQATASRQLRDWNTLYSVWINMASAYLLLHRPILALHYLSLLVAPADNAFLADSSMTLDDQSWQPNVPKSLHSKVLFILSHCVFSLSRFRAGSETCDNLMTAKSQPSACNTHNRSSSSHLLFPLGIPESTCERIYRLLRDELNITLDLDLQSPSEDAVINILKQYETMLMELVKLRHSPILYPVLLEAAALLTSSNDNHGASSQFNFSPIDASHSADNFRADSLKRSIAYIHLTIAKVSWVLAGSNSKEDKSVRRNWFEQARQALEATVSGSFMNNAADHHSIHRLFGKTSVSGSSTQQGLVRGMLSDLLSAMGDHLDMHLGNQLDVGRPLVNGYLGPMVFATVVDLLRFAQYLSLCKQPLEPSSSTTPCPSGSDHAQSSDSTQSQEREFGLFKMLGVPERTVSTIIHALVNAAMTLYESQIGACGTCLPILVESLKSDMNVRSVSGAKDRFTGEPDSTSLPYAFSVLFRHQAIGGDFTDDAATRLHALLPCAHHHHNIQV
ncbi:hypothetical protein BDV3_001536 [Batrachochytrium dendrobatidis]